MDVSPQPYHINCQEHWTTFQTESQIEGDNQQYRRIVAGALRTLGLVYWVFALLLIVVGIIGIYYGAPDVPYVIPLHINTGVLMLVAGVCAYVAAGRTQKEQETTKVTKALILSVFGLDVAGIALSFLTVFINGAMGVIFCLGVEYRRNGTEQEINDQCTENVTENIAISGVAIGLGILSAVWCILSATFFCKYGRVYGIKSSRKP